MASDRLLRFVFEGCCGAFLAALIAVCILFFWFSAMNWLIVGLAALAGFVSGGLWGENAIELLKWLFSWI